MKASGSYVSLVQGVSQQVAHDRNPGQCTEQINMLSDPVTGLARRRGSEWQAEANLGISTTFFAALQRDTDSFRSMNYSYGGKEYTVLYRSGTRDAGSGLPPVIVYNKTDKVFLTFSRNVTDTILDALSSGGISAVVNVGQYLFFAGHTINPTASTTQVWSAAANQAKAVVWIRGGAYSRTFKVSATKTDNSTVNFEYTTPTSSYQGTLDTSGVAVYAADPAGGTTVDTEAAYITVDGSYGIATLGWAAWAPTGMTVKNGTTTLTNVTPANPANAGEYRWVAGAETVRFHSSLIGQVDVTMSYTHTKTVTNPNYAKIVGDLTNDYNTAVTQWIGTAADAIQPEAIAEQLKVAAVAAGLTTAVRKDGHVIFDNVKALTVSDSGDGTLIRGVANEVSSIDEVSAIHAVGKTIKVTARAGEDGFYLKAVAKDPAVTSGYTEVTWVEGVGTQYNVTAALVYGTAVGTTFHMAGSATLLNAIAGGSAPTWEASTVGDADTSPLPYFIGNKITYLGVFQDRLMIGSGGVIRASRVGDYLNVFRSSVLTIPADDAFEMLSQGSEDDELRHSVLYDRSLIVFGKDRQYAIDGRNVLSPTGANMPVMSSHSEAASLPPVAVGGLIYYAKRGVGASSVHQIQPGLVAESPESFDASSQLETYIAGNAIEMVAVPKPAMLFVRATGDRQSLFTFRYKDAPDGRQQDAWSRWTYGNGTGPIIGMAATAAGLLTFSIRTAHSATWVVADLTSLDPGLSARPYLDSNRAWSVVATNTGSIRTTSTVPKVAYDNTTEWFLLGADIADKASLDAAYPSASGLYAGFEYNSWFTPTNPFIRDRNDKAITSGRLTITRLLVSIVASSGMAHTLQSRGGSVTEEFNGRVLGDPLNIIGRVPVSAATVSVPIGRETNEYTVILKARDWKPFTITSIEWVGQFFNRTQRY